MEPKKTEEPKLDTEPKKIEPEPKPGEKKPTLLNEKDESAGPPAKYEFTVPDGFVLDEAAHKEVSELFTGMKLSNADGQKLVDLYIAKTKEAAEAPFKAMQTMREDWQSQVKADKEIGNKLPEVKQSIGKALDSLGDAKLANDFREAMDLTGAGDHPAFIKAFYKLSQKVTEGTHVRGSGPSQHGQGAPGSKPATGASALYPNLP